MLLRQSELQELIARNSVTLTEEEVEQIAKDYK